MPDFYSESVAINAIWHLVGEIPEAKILLSEYSSKLLVAADFKIIISSSFRDGRGAELPKPPAGASPLDPTGAAPRTPAPHSSVLPPPSRPLPHASNN